MLKYEKRMFSQHGEDGIIDRIFKIIKSSNRCSLEIGATYREANTLNLMANGWHSLLIDCQGDGVFIKRHFVTMEKINDILSAYMVNYYIDLFSIDIDSIDFYILKAMNLKPRVVILEYNGCLPFHSMNVIEYNPKTVWNGTNYFGASLGAYNKLMEEKGYVLIYCESTGTNAFYVLKEYSHYFTNAGDINKLYVYPKYQPFRKDNRKWIQY